MGRVSLCYSIDTTWMWNLSSTSGKRTLAGGERIWNILSSTNGKRTLAGGRTTGIHFSELLHGELLHGERDRPAFRKTEKIPP